MNKKNGFTLTELLIVMAIIAVLAIVVAGILNPVSLMNKGKDAQRKKDLGRIKVAFEEYFSDKGVYPADVEDWNIKENCNSTTIPSISSYLSPWPCDPSGEPYKVFGETSEFRAITNLGNKKDKDIPKDWYERTDITIINNYTQDEVNYGVSSSNILWYDNVAKDYSMCNTSQCNAFDGPNCEDRTAGGCLGASGNCYYGYGGRCDEACKLTPDLNCN